MKCYSVTFQDIANELKMTLDDLRADRSEGTARAVEMVAVRLPFTPPEKRRPPVTETKAPKLTYADKPLLTRVSKP